MNFHGINIFAAINGVHDDFVILIKSKLNSEEVQLGERTQYVSLAFSRQKGSICYDVFIDPVTASYYNANYKIYMSRALSLQELDDMFLYFSFGQARVNSELFKEHKTLSTCKRLPILRPKPEMRMTYLTMFGLSPHVRVNHLEMFIDILTRGCLPYKARTHEQIQKYIYSRFAESNSTINSHLERFEHDKICSSNLLTIMALEEDLEETLY